jgi:hypothetical protein
LTARAHVPKMPQSYRFSKHSQPYTSPGLSWIPGSAGAASLRGCVTVCGVWRYEFFIQPDGGEGGKPKKRTGNLKAPP